jgi:ParB family chromosome partitioning protein
MTLILLSSRSDEWYTPSHIVELSRTVLGEIDLDPASCQFANETVKAKRYIDAKEDGLSSSWGTSPVTVFLNPPSGRYEGKSLMKQFWQKLVDTRNAGMLEQAIFVGFSLEQLQVTQNCTESIGSYPICIPRRRVKFVSPSGTFNSPTHGQVIAYIPGNTNVTSKFYEVFGALGNCLSPRAT